MQILSPFLMLVTDRRRGGPQPLIEAIELAVTAEVDAVQLREKDLEPDELYELALECRRITTGRCLFVVNGRLDIALAAGADGVHLPERGLPVEAVRRIAPAGFIVGRSVHSVSAARHAETQGAEYIELGTIFETASKPGLEPAGLALVRETTKQIGIPCLAVGGIDAQNAAAVLAAGAQGVAVVSAILQAENIPAAVRSLRLALAVPPSAFAPSPKIGRGPRSETQ